MSHSLQLIIVPLMPQLDRASKYSSHFSFDFARLVKCLVDELSASQVVSDKTKKEIELQK